MTDQIPPQDPQVPGQQPQQPYGAPPQGYYPPPQPPKKKKWPWILGAIILVFVLLLGGCMALIGGAAKSIDDQSKKSVDVTYEVVPSGQPGTTGSTAGSITYTNGDLNMAQDTSASLPWRKDISITGLLKVLSLTATNDQDGLGITCRISQGGEVISENTATGPYASASCSGTAK